MTVIAADFPRGSCPIHCFGDETERSKPVVLLFMDAFGPRPALFDVAQQIAADGYRVFLPDLFYEHLPYTALRQESVFCGGDDRQRLIAMLHGLDQPALDADISSLLGFYDDRLEWRADRSQRLLHGRAVRADSCHVEPSGRACGILSRQQSRAGERCKRA